MRLLTPAQTSHAHEANHHVDTKHLEGFPAIFKSNFDLVLTARDGSQQIAFPVHQIVIAQHSPVLSSMLEDLHNENSSKTASILDLPCLPMVGDSCSAIQTALAFMYNRLPKPSEIPTRLRQAPWPLKLTLDMVPSKASQAEFAHKHGMIGFQIAQEAALLEPLCDEMDVNMTDWKSTVSQVLDCAAAAAHFNLGAVLAVCEALIIKRFLYYTEEAAQLESKLSVASMHRIARFIYYKSHIQRMDEVCDVVFAAYLEEVPAAQEASAVIVRCLKNDGAHAWRLRELQEYVMPQLVV